MVCVYTCVFDVLQADLYYVYLSLARTLTPLACGCVCESCESNINIKNRHLNSVRLSSASLFDAVSHMFVGTYFNMLTNGMMLIKRKFYS